MQTFTDDSRALPKRRALTARAAGDETLLSDPESGQVHFFNRAAALVWDCCDGETTESECVRRLRAAFNIPPEADVAADVRAILAGFQQKNLLERNKADA